MFLQRIPYQSVRRRRIRDWALLVLRLAALTLIVLAFARPFFRRAHAGRGRPERSARSGDPAGRLLQHGLRRPLAEGEGGGARRHRPDAARAITRHWSCSSSGAEVAVRSWRRSRHGSTRRSRLRRQGRARPATRPRSSSPAACSAESALAPPRSDPHQRFPAPRLGADARPRRHPSAGPDGADPRQRRRRRHRQTSP